MKNQKGFSLLGVLTSVGIILVLTAIGYGVQRNAKRAARENFLKDVHTKMKLNLEAMANSYINYQKKVGAYYPEIMLHWESRDKIYGESPHQKWRHNHIYFFPKKCVEKFNKDLDERGRYRGADTGNYYVGAVLGRTNYDTVVYGTSRSRNPAGDLQFSPNAQNKLKALIAAAQTIEDDSPLNKCPVYALGDFDDDADLDVWKIETDTLKIVQVSGD